MAANELSEAPAFEVSGIWSYANRLADEPLMQALGACVIAYVIYRLGLRAYAHQKDSEHVRSRLVDNGIDLLAANLDYLLSVERHNWQMMLRHLKIYREIEGTADVAAFLASIQEADSSRFQIVAAKRVSDLLNEPLIWIGCQKLYSFVGTKTDFIVGDFGSALKAGLAQPGTFDKAHFVEAASAAAMEMGNEVETFYRFTSQVANLAGLADIHVRDRRSAATFRDLPAVKEIILTMKADFGAWTVND